MNFSKETIEFLGEERVLRIRLEDAQSTAGLFFYLGAVFPLLLLTALYLVRAMEADGMFDGTGMMLDAGIVFSWLNLVLSPAIFVPRAKRHAREARALKAQLVERGAVVEPRVRYFSFDAAAKRQALHIVVAVGLVVVGKFVEGSTGELLKWIGLAGIVVVGIMLVFSNDVLIGGKDKD